MTPNSPPEQIACPTCDAIYDVQPGARLSCERCHTRLIDPEARVGLRLLLVSLLSAALIFGAVTYPFLTIKRFWMTSDATIIDTALAFDGPLLFLSIIVLALILLLPALRLALTIYVVAPLVLKLRPLPLAKGAFGWAERLRPWSMAEIFIIGCVVALTKIIAMAEVTFGPAFYMFAGLVILLWAQDKLLCRYSLWKALEK
ncbi:MAG: paraquat-inducible protein A [Paracoccaceae bacterium]|nr:paraquat-inducible protein A [Paracoccaceae bacterium]